MSVPEANTPALRTLALWDLAEPMARLLLDVHPIQDLPADRFKCMHCSGPVQGCDDVGPFPHAEGCPWAPGGLIERIRALVPEETHDERR